MLFWFRTFPSGAIVRSQPSYVTLVRLKDSSAGPSGLVGYSLKADLFRKQFGTLSAWESEVALDDFVGRKPHSSVMASLRPFMGKTKFVKWRLPGSELPPSWDDALQRL